MSREDQSGDHRDPGQKAGQDAGRPGPLPEQAQNGAREELGNAVIADQKQVDQGAGKNQGENKRHGHDDGHERPRQSHHRALIGRRTEDRLVDVLGQESRGEQDQHGCGHHGRDRPRGPDEPEEPGRVGLLDEGQEGQVAVFQAGDDEQGRETDHEDQEDEKLVDRHDDRVAPQDLLAPGRKG